MYYKEVHEGNSYTYELTDKSEVLLPKLDHEFDECKWTWGRSTYDGGIMAILRMECKNCHRAISTVSYSDEITSEVTTEPGEYTEGERTYTVTQTHYGQTYTNTYTEPIPMTHAVAMIGQKSYSSLEAAFDDVEANEIVLLCEDVNKPNAECNNGRESFSFILDLGSHSATLGSIDMSGNLTVKNGTLRCIINNLNVGNDQTLTLDHAEVQCEEVSRYNELQELVSYWGLQWLAKNIVVTNGSQLYIVGSTYLGGGAENGFNLDIDGTSCVVLERANLSGYNDARVRSEFSRYLPEGYSINTDYDEIQDGEVTYGGSVFTDPVTLSPATIILADRDDNSTAITANHGYKKDVKLEGRTLYKDGNWNTICLPFDLTIKDSPLDDDGVDVRTLSSSDFSNGTLTLNFTAKGDVTTLAAGVPYIIKWNNNTESPTLYEPVFRSVTIKNELHPVTQTYIDFVGGYTPVRIDTEGDNTLLYLGSGNTLYWPNASMTIGAQRAYFRLKDGYTEAKIRAFVLNFDDDSEETGISDTPRLNDKGQMINDSWYDLSGRKLNGKPTTKGLYINNGRKVVICEF